MIHQKCVAKAVALAFRWDFGRVQHVKIQRDLCNPIHEQITHKKGLFYWTSQKDLRAQELMV